jgi:predicted transposase YbfD/YdcC
MIIEDHYYLTSLSPGKKTPEELLSLVRGHWLIENELHHVKDRTMHEDAQRHGPGATTMARLRSLAVGLFRSIAGASIPAKQGRLQANPRIALKLLTLKRKTKYLL